MPYLDILYYAFMGGFCLIAVLSAMRLLKGGIQRRGFDLEAPESRRLSALNLMLFSLSCVFGWLAVGAPLMVSNGIFHLSNNPSTVTWYLDMYSSSVILELYLMPASLPDLIANPTNYVGPGNLNHGYLLIGLGLFAWCGIGAFGLRTFRSLKADGHGETHSRAQRLWLVAQTYIGIIFGPAAIFALPSYAWYGLQIGLYLFAVFAAMFGVLMLFSRFKFRLYHRTR